MNHAKTILPALLGLLVLFWTGDKMCLFNRKWAV